MHSVERIEQKYYISFEDGISLQDELCKIMYPDKNGENGYYKIRSLYYDSINNIDYFDKLNGVYRRKKVRIRTYGDGFGSIKLEVKEKAGIYQKKVSLLLSHEEADEMLGCRYAFLLERPEQISKMLYLTLTQGAYRPITVIEYDRRALTYPEFNTRITFDKNIRKSSFCNDFWESKHSGIPVMDDHMILEIKFDGMLVKSIKKVLEKYPLFQVSAGKYTMSRGEF